MDEDDYLDQREIDILMLLYLHIKVQRWPRVTWGVHSASREIRAFNKVACALDEGDYLVKVDSDILFVSSWIFSLVLNSGADAVGDGHYVDFSFFQGGCYFLQKAAVRLLEPFGDEPTLAGIYPEDRRCLGEDEYLYHLLRHVGASVWLTRYMAFPDEFRRFRGIGLKEKNKYSMLHFTKLKDEMIPNYVNKLFF